MSPSIPNDTNGTRVTEGRRPGWLWMYNHIIDNYADRLGLAGLGLYTMLCRFANDDRQCWPSLATLAKRTGVSRQMIIQKMKLLESSGLVTVETRPDIKSNVYTLVDLFTTEQTSSQVPIQESSQVPIQVRSLPKQELIKTKEQDTHTEQLCVHLNTTEKPDGIVADFLRRKDSTRMPTSNELEREQGLIAEFGLDATRAALPGAMDRASWADSFMPVADQIAATLRHQRQDQHERQERIQNRRREQRQEFDRKDMCLYVQGFREHWPELPQELQSQIDAVIPPRMRKFQAAVWLERERLTHQCIVKSILDSGTIPPEVDTVPIE